MVGGRKEMEDPITIRILNDESIAAVDKGVINICAFGGKEWNKKWNPPMESNAREVIW